MQGYIMLGKKRVSKDGYSWKITYFVCWIGHIEQNPGIYACDVKHVSKKTPVPFLATNADPVFPNVPVQLVE